MVKPEISIIVPAYNRARVLSQTLDSCLMQSIENIEVIVVDDGSTDETSEVVEGYLARDPRIRLFKTLNMGQCVARNIGASLAEASWLWFLDSDDLILPHSLETLLRAVTVCGTRIALGSEQCFWESELDTVQRELRALPPAPPQRMQLWGYWPAQQFSFNAVLIDRMTFIRSGGFSPTLRVGEENNLIMRVLLKEPDISVAVVATKLLLKRWDRNSLAWEASRGDVPWGLVALLQTAEFLERSRTVDSEVRRWLLDQLYYQAAWALRRGQKAFALQAIERWRKTRSPRPKFSVWYQDLLHKTLGFELSETLLRRARQVRSAL
jgi:glycosyltransferase involved in cell wall biosynthesis